MKERKQSRELKIVNNLLKGDKKDKDAVKHEIKNDAAVDKAKEKAVIKDPIIAYFGAGWDFKSINKPYYKKVNHFIFIDALPKLSHYDKDQAGYEKSKNKEALIKTLKEYAREEGYELKEAKGNYLKFKKDKRVIDYYINTTVQDALANKEISNKLNRAVWTHIQGFHPHEYGLNYKYSKNLVANRGELKKRIAHK